MTAATRPLKRYCVGPPEYGLNIPSGEYSDEGVRFLRTTDIGTQGGLAEGDGVFVPEALALDPRHQLLPGDLLVSRSGSLGRCLRFEAQHGPATFAGYLVRFRPGPEADPRFLEYCVQSKPFQSAIEADAITSTISNFNAERYASIAIPDVPLAEQRAIADYLDAETARIDALIAKKQELIHLLEERWNATIDTVIGDLPGPRVPLRRFVRLITQGVSPQAGTFPYSPGQRGLLKLSAVRFGEFRPYENKELDTDFDFSRAIVPSRGDLLVTRANTPNLVGDACAVRDADPNVVLCDLIYLLRLDDRLTAEFAAYVLIGKRSKWELSSLARGTSQSMVKLRGEDVVSVRVPAPSVRVQAEVVRRLDSRRSEVGGATDRLRRQIDLISQHRQALITAAVTGEFRVPGAA